METTIISAVALKSTQTFAYKQAEQAQQFSVTLEQIQLRITTFGSSKLAGKTMLEGVQELGIVGYAKEKRLDELREQIRNRVYHDLGITGKQYQGLRCGIRELKAGEFLFQSEIDRLATMADELNDEIEKEVERRLQEHLAAEAQSGGQITNTLVYDKGSKECKEAVDKLKDMLGKVVGKYVELKGKEERAVGTGEKG